MFTTLNRTFLSYALAIVLVERILNRLPLGTHDWEKFVTPDELRKLLVGCGLDVKFHCGMYFNLLANKWRWTEDDSVNYVMTAFKPHVDT